MYCLPPPPPKQTNKQKMGGYIETSCLFVCMSVSATVSGLYLSYAEAMELISSHNNCLKPEGVS